MWNVKFQVEEGEQEENDSGREKAKEVRERERETLEGVKGGRAV